MQRSYWDLSIKERAELTSEQVEAFTAAELMQAGVLRAVPPQLEPEPARPEPTVPLIRVKGGKYGNDLDVAFQSVADAMAFLALRPLAVDRDYIGNDLIFSFREVASNAEVGAAKMFAEADVTLHKAALVKHAEIKAANKKAQEEYEKAIRAEQDTLVRLWSDWRECQAKEARADRVLATFTEYVGICNDSEMARTFLAKAFTREQILEAKEWWGDVGVDLPKVIDAEFPEVGEEKAAATNGTEDAHAF